MIDFINYLVKGVTDSDKFEVFEESEENRLIYTIKADPEIIGMIIGKNGSTIKSLQELIRVRAKQENTFVYLNVTEI